MKRINNFLGAMLLMTGALQAGGQSIYFHQDSTAHSFRYANALATDSLNSLYALPVKLHVEYYDRGDSVNGATFTFFIYSVSYQRCFTFLQSTFGISGSAYNNWDSNNDSETYSIARQALLNQKIYLTFQE